MAHQDSHEQCCLNNGSDDALKGVIAVLFCDVLVLVVADLCVTCICITCSIWRSCGSGSRAMCSASCCVSAAGSSVSCLELCD